MKTSDPSFRRGLRALRRLPGILSVAALIALSLPLTSCKKDDDGTEGAEKGVTRRSSYTYTTQELSFTYDGKYISGTAFIPDDYGGPIPTAILCHGLGGNRKDCIDYAKACAAKGYACYTFDFYGGGRYIQSGGTMTEMSVLTELDDLNAVIDRLKRESWVDTKRLFLSGGSQGGLVAALAAAGRPSEIKNLVLLFPAFNIPDVIRLLYPTIDDVPEKISIFGWDFGHVYAEGMYDLDVYGTIGKYGSDVLILHGTADLLVNISYSQKAEKTYKKATLVTLQGQGHGFTGEGFDKSLAEILKFLDSHVK